MRDVPTQPRTVPVTSSLMHRPFLATARAHPQRIALSADEGTTSYAELEALSRGMAHILHRAGVRSGDRVAILLPKSVAAVAAILGVLRIGAIYVPLDIASAISRLAQITGDCGLEYCLVMQSSLELVGGIAAIAGPFRWLGTIDQRVPKRVNGVAIHEAAGWTDIPLTDWERADLVADRPAYILYTSGSTGVPKGVVLSHANGRVYVDWACEEFAIQPEDVVVSQSPLHFDPSIFDLFVSFSAGARVVLVSPERSVFPADVVDLLRAHQVTVWFAIPSSLRLSLDRGGLAQSGLPSLRVLLFGGEVFPMDSLRQLMGVLPGTRFCHVYGPTETNVCTRYWLPGIPGEEVDAIPIGDACAGADVFAVREDGRIVTECSQEGELYVAGPTVMLGYWGDVEATERVLRPLAEMRPGRVGRVYRTGDFVRFNEEGEYLFLGRRDQMVKRRGHRIELAEIETALNRHPAVEHAVAVAVDDGRSGVLIDACVVITPGSTVQENELRRHCAHLLPLYMLPDGWHFLTDAPLTPTGKLDRQAITRLARDPAAVRAATRPANA